MSMRAYPIYKVDSLESCGEYFFTPILNIVNLFPAWDTLPVIPWPLYPQNSFISAWRRLATLEGKSPRYCVFITSYFQLALAYWLCSTSCNKGYPLLRELSKYPYSVG